jgi:hypothetical protein
MTKSKLKGVLEIPQALLFDQSGVIYVHTAHVDDVENNTPIYDCTVAVLRPSARVAMHSASMASVSVMSIIIYGFSLQPSHF